VDPFIAVFHLAYIAGLGDTFEGSLSVNALTAEHAHTPLVLFEASLDGDHSGLARQALALEPTFVEARLVLGEAAAEAGQVGEAQRHYEAVARALPGSAGAERALADLYFTIGDLPRALDAYDHVIAAEPDIHALLRKGVILTVSDRPSEALGVLYRVVESGWRPGEANYWLGQNHLRLGALEQADICVAQAKRTQPTEPSTLLLAAQIAIARERWNGAETDLTTAVDIARANEGYAGTETLCESLFLKGRVASHNEDWPSGLGDFTASRECYAAARANLSQQGERIRKWDLPPDQERVLLLRNDQEALRTEGRIAGASYYGAVCALRSGERETAAVLAGEAAKSFLFKSRAEELLSKLAER